MARTIEPGAVLEAALKLAGMEYAVFPLKPNSKRPATNHGFKDGTTDPDTIRAAFANVRANLGIAWNQGIIVVDLDVPKDDTPNHNPLPGAREYADRLAPQYEETYPELLAAPRMRTRADGVQWVLRLPAAATIRSNRKAVELEGGGRIDVKGNGGGYSMAPPSVMPPGAYSWERPLVKPQDLPEASEQLLAHLAPKPIRATPPRPPQHPTAPAATATPEGVKVIEGDPARYADGLLAGVRARLAAITTSRNEACYAEGLTLGRWVGAYAAANLPGLTEHEATAALRDAMRANGDYDEDPQKAENTIRDSLRNGIASAYTVTHHPKRPSTPAPRGAPPRDPSDPGPTEDDGAGLDHHPAREPIAIVREAPRADERLAHFDHTDAGNAERLLHLFRNRLRYCAGLGWLVWTGTHWQPDGRDHPTASRLALLAMRATAAAAEYLDRKDDREALHKHARRSQNAKALQALMQVAAFIDPTVLVSVNDLDRDPWLLNVENGLLDLRTATLHPHNREAMCTRIAPTRFDPDARHPAFAALLDVLNQDGRAKFLQAIAGQALTGRSAKALYLLTGPSGTVKSTTADALAAVLGPDYAVQLDPQTLLVNPHGNSAGGARADLVAIRGARLAIAAELPNGGRLDGVLVKRLTGGDPITARAPYATEVMTFTPGHTVLVHSNHDPKIDWTDDGMRARVMPVPFTIRPDKPDPAIRAALLEDPNARAAMLTWATIGAVGWHRDGQRDPTPPELVTRRKAAYLREQNPFTAWADDALNATGNYTDFIASAALHANYRAWCDANGERAQSAKALGQYLASTAEELGITAEKRKHARGWSGLTLLRRTE